MLACPGYKQVTCYYYRFAEGTQHLKVVTLFFLCNLSVLPRYPKRCSRKHYIAVAVMLKTIEYKGKQILIQTIHSSYIHNIFIIDNNIHFMQIYIYINLFFFQKHTANLPSNGLEHKITAVCA